MPGRLAGRVAVVTGATAGIGRQVAALFTSEGATVAELDLDARVPTDVTDPAQVDAAFERIEQELGPPTVLVNCAGGSRSDDGPVDSLDPATLRATLDLDLGGTVSCVRAAVPRMRRAGGGSIVNLTSYVAFDGSSRTHAYVAAKGAVASLTRALAGTYGPDGIRVNAVAPGIVLTDRIRARLALGSGTLDEVRSTHPFAVGQPEQVASVVLFLAGDESALLTGCVIHADGGLSEI
jgi:NAD(P)-dependent dehydrogenase (short-subunit alcohol dehydrogenase family)